MLNLLYTYIIMCTKNTIFFRHIGGNYIFCDKSNISHTFFNLPTIDMQLKRSLI